MKRTFALAMLLVAVWGAMAQKSIYIPHEWKNPWPADSLLYAEEDTEGKYTWTKSRSRESENFIVFWDKYYTKAPDELAKTDFFYVDIDDLLRKCEAFFELECNELGFVNPATSNVAKYKIMVLMNHTRTWTCYGSGYDYQVPALWLNPSTCKPVGHSVAHEVGHSFHYMCYSEDSNHGANTSVQTGFHGAVGNGSVSWEQTAQWQANQSYPELMFDQSIGVFRNSHNYAFTHEWHRYQSYWFYYYLCQLLGKRTAVADVWNYHMTQVQDFNQVLMKQQKWNNRTLYQHYYDYAARCATWDFDACIPYRNAYIGDFHYAAVQTGDRSYQVAFESTPQSTGFNVIPLVVPEAGSEVKATFVSLAPSNNTPLAEGDPARYLNGNTQWENSGRTTYFTTGGPGYKGFRLGFVALLRDGTRQYIHRDTVYCQGAKNNTAELTATVPEGTERMWMIVSPAPTKYYQHLWDEKYNVNDDAWPYQVAFEGTDINESRATIYVPSQIDGRPISDATFIYDVRLPKRSDYSAVGVTVGSSAAALLSTAFQLNVTDIAAKLQAWTTSGPRTGQVMFYPINSKTVKTVNRGSTANGYGHWFNSNGGVSEYGSGYVFSEFQPSSLTFNIGQYPGKVKVGDTYTIGQALVYNDGTSKATAYFVFRIHITDGDAGYELVEKTNAIEPIADTPQANGDARRFDLSGRQTTNVKRGIYIQNNRKLVAP